MLMRANLDNLNEVANLFDDNGIYLLQGNLASGKTTLVKEIVKNKISKNASSPTFSVLNTYKNDNKTIYHYDIYQKGTKAFIENGLYENLFNDGLHLIEWADLDFEKMLNQFGLDYTVVKITCIDEGRLYEFN